MLTAMPSKRRIFASGLILVMFIAWVPRFGMASMPKPQESHSCCTKYKAPHQSTPAPDHKKNPCDGSNTCSMECCRIIPVAPDSLPDLASRAAVAEVRVHIVEIHSLTDPDTLFHPPRA